MSNSNDNEVKRGDFAKKKGEVVLREHEYDGIQEYDQKLPNWWLFTFYGAIIFFVAYWVIYYYTDKIQTDQEQIITQVKQLQEDKKKALADTLSSLNDQILIEQWAADDAIVTNGSQTYAQVCIACHGAELDATMSGVPLPGRSLVDDEWTYGKAPMSIFKMINEGTPAGAPGYNGVPMIAKGGGNLTLKQVAELTAFIVSKNPNQYENLSYDAEGNLVE